MKTKLIFGSLLAITGMANAQTWTSAPGQLTTGGSVGIGTVTPAAQLHIATSGATQFLVERTTGQVNGLKLFFTSNPATGIAIGSGSSIFQNQNSSSSDMLFMPTPTSAGLIIKSGGNVGIGTISPVEKLSVSTGVANDGISITQTGSNASALHLYNTTTGGTHWSLFSTGNGNTQGSGNFSIYQYSAGTDRLFIEGTKGYIGVNTISPIARLHATETTNSPFSDAISVYGSSISNDPNSQSIGLYGVSSGGLAGNAVLGVSKGGASSMGGVFTAGNGQPLLGGKSIGVYGGLNDNIANFNAGVYGDANGFAGAWAGWFEGDVFTTGSYLPSDRRLKKNIKSMENSLDIINKLNPVTYNFDVENHKQLSLPETMQYGFISQEIQQILPELTRLAVEPGKRDKNGKEIAPSTEILSLNYNGFIAILIKGMQEQQKQIDAQQQTINALMNNAGNAGTTTGIGQISSPLDGFSLDQNIPNPFSSETIINYNLPEQVQTASLIVYDLTGKQITSMPITQKGKGSVTVTSEKLQAGIYIYSVVADGKILDSKRMVLSEK